MSAMTVRPTEPLEGGRSGRGLVPLGTGVMLASMLLLGGCLGLADAAVSVGAKVVEEVLEEGPTRVEGKVVVDKNVNPDDEDRPSPVVVRVYELKSESAFMSSDFFELFDDDEAVLGENLVNSEEFQLAPGAEVTFERDLQEGSRIIGVMAAYQRLYESTWRTAIEVPPNETSELEFVIGRLEVAILTEEEIERRDEQQEEMQQQADAEAGDEPPASDDGVDVPTVGAAPELPQVPTPPVEPPMPGAGDRGATGGVTP